MCGMAFCAWVGAEASIGIVACEDVAHGAIAVKLVECPRSGYRGKGGNMTRYHFDKCKN